MTEEMRGRKVYFVDLFAGAGGLSCGLEMAGLECALAVEMEPAAVKTFALNHRNAAIHADDVSKLDRKAIQSMTKGKKISLVCGGPPCQGMSTVGEGIPDDPRNYLFLQFVRIVSVLKPEFVLMENVTGMLGKKNQKILNGILKKFRSIGYVMHAKVMSAENYGVPQKRRRTIFIGNRMGYDIEFPKPTHGRNGGLKPIVTVGEAIANLRAASGEVLNHDVNSARISNDIARKRVERIPEGRGIRYEEDERDLLPKSLWLGIDWKSIDEGRLREEQYHRLSRSDVSPTIMTGRHTYYHPTETRHLTVREAAAIQSFPNSFEFAGSIAQQWRQVGNAVPPLLGKALGETITKMLREKRKAKILQPLVIRQNAFDYEKDLTEENMTITKFTSG